ncbi:hypothetical protein [Glycomyces tarimensis]
MPDTDATCVHCGASACTTCHDCGGDFRRGDPYACICGDDYECCVDGDCYDCLLDAGLADHY